MSHSAAGKLGKPAPEFIFSISRIEEPDRRYTRLDMLKVRDQDLCRTGSVRVCEAAVRAV